MNYRFPSSGTSGANQRSQTNLDTARDATSSTTAISMASSNFTQNYAGSIMSRIVPQGSSQPNYTYTVYNGIINSFDSSGITTTVSEAEFRRVTYFLSEDYSFFDYDQVNHFSGGE